MFANLEGARATGKAVTQVASLGHPIPALDLRTLYGMRLPAALF
jgi:hypothetical protein